MEPLTVVLLVLGVVVVALALWAVATYNGLVRLRNLVQEAWRQIDVELHRRHDLVPRLVATVEPVAAQDRDVLEEVAGARAAAAGPGDTPARQAEHENRLTAALGRLFAVADAHPSLRAAEELASLQAELTDTEDRIAAGRRFYNANVRQLNTTVESFPRNVVARLFGFRPGEYFEANDPAVRATPAVTFDPGAQEAGAPATDDGGPGDGATGTPPAR